MDFEEVFASSMSNLEEYKDIYIKNNTFSAVSLVPIYTKKDGSSQIIASKSLKTGMLTLIGGLINSRPLSEDTPWYKARYRTIHAMHSALFYYTYKMTGIVLTKESFIRSRVFFQTDLFRNGSSVIHYIHITEEMAEQLLQRDLWSMSIDELQTNQNCSKVMEIIDHDILSLVEDRDPFRYFIVEQN
jgi:hypothetical protein